MVSPYWVSDRIDEALQDFSKAVEINPDDTDSYFYCALACMKKGDYHRAVLDFSKVIKRKQGDANLYCDRGLALLHLKEWKRAKADLITAENMGVDIIAAFHNDCKNIADFEQKHHVQLPPDIAAILKSEDT